MREPRPPLTARILDALDGWQRRHAVGGFPVAVVKKFGDDRASSLAALMAYYAFFSLFPLLLVFVSVLGFVLQGDPSLQRDIVDSALARIPIVGAQLAGDVEPLQGSTPALVLGLAGAVWAGLGVTLALGRALQAIWDVPRMEQRGPVRSRLLGIAVLLVLATALIAATLLGGLAVGGHAGAGVERAAAVLLSLVVNGAVFLAVFRLLTPRAASTRALLPGVGLAAAGSLALQAAGGWYVEHTITNASETYGAFALVIGLLSWFWLGSHLLLIAAEVNVVLDWHLWPRSLRGDLEPADRRALRRSAAAARQDARQEITVEFGAADDAGIPGDRDARHLARPPRSGEDRPTRADGG